MIITANGNAHSVDIRKGFKPKYIRALKFDKTLSGKYYVSDRGADSDKYTCKFTVIDEDTVITPLVKDLYSESGQITIDTEGFNIFGDGIDHSGLFICNYSFKNYPITNIRTATVEIAVKVVSAIVYDSSVVAELPSLFYKYPVKRSISTYKNSYDSMAIGDYGNNVLVDYAGQNMKSEGLAVSITTDCNDFAKLHKFIAELRGDYFLLNNNEHFKPFLDSSSEYVKILKFDYSPNGEKYWNVSLTLTNDFIGNITPLEVLHERLFVLGEQLYI